MKFEIQKLTKDSPYFETVCDWIYHWWDKEDAPYEKVCYFIAHSIGDDIPQAWIAVCNDEVVGFYQILMCDLSIRPDLYPWLANLYVKASYRGQGIGRKLIEHAIDQTKKTGFQHLYLHSKHIHLYEKFGFVFLEETPHFYPKKIYILDLKSHE